MTLFKQPYPSHLAGSGIASRLGRNLFAPGTDNQRIDSASKTLAAIAALMIVASCAPLSHAQAPKKVTSWNVDPTYLYRDSNTAPDQPSDMTTATCHFKPLFGVGDPNNPPVTTDGDTLGSVSRFSKVVVDPNGSCATVQYPKEDQIYVVLNGTGSAAYADQGVPLKAEDFLYIPATVQHTLKNPSSAPFAVLIMGFHTDGYEAGPLPAQPLVSNIEDVPIEALNGHPDTTHYRLLLGPATGKRDKFDVGRVVVSLFLMEIDPGGTNHPHHHFNAEEIYFDLSGHGEEVAGDGGDGTEGKHPAKPGDAWFYRENGTVGYYSAPGIKSRVLAVRSTHPGWPSRQAAH